METSGTEPRKTEQMVPGGEWETRRVVSRMEETEICV